MRYVSASLAAVAISLVQATSGFSQTTLLRETFDSLSGSLPAGWTAMPAAPGSWTTSPASPSGGYSGASGGSNLLAVNSLTGQTLSLIFQDDCATIHYSGITVQWLARRTSSFTNSPILEWSADGTIWHPVPFADVPGTAAWTVVNGGTPIPLPAAAEEVADLRLRWSYTAAGGSGSYRIDDVVVRGMAGQTADGAGTARIMNVTPGSFSGTRMVPASTSGLAITVAVSGMSNGDLQSVRISVPPAYSMPSGATAGGAFGGMIPLVSGRSITLSPAGLGPDTGTITITGLTSPDPSGAMKTGVDTFLVETSAPGGVLTPIVHSPVLWTVIPIRNLRTGGADGFGNTGIGHDIPVLDGVTVAVSGVVTLPSGVLADTTGTAAIVQDGTGGIWIDQPGTNTLRLLGRGDVLAVRGKISRQYGSTVLRPAAMVAPDFVRMGTLPMPLPAILPGAAAVTEAYEGTLVSIPSVEWSSPGAAFDTVNAGTDNFRTGTDTGTIFVARWGELYGSPVPDISPVTGIVAQRRDCLGGGAREYKIVPSGRSDLGGRPADGSGTALFLPAARLSGSVAVAETLTINGTGSDTIGGLRLTIPSEWSWSGIAGDVICTGPGFASAAASVSGDGSGTHPWTVTVTQASVSALRSGSIILRNLGTPPVPGYSLYALATRGINGLLASVASPPGVNIVTTAFDAARSGNWNDPATWVGGVVPGPADNVALSTPNILVTINDTTAVCRNCTLAGIGAAPGSGIMLQFRPEGAARLTVGGRLVLSGGSGGGGGDRGGRPRLASNGNASAVLVVKGSVLSSVSNSPSNGSAGLNMNEGMVRLAGSATDTMTGTLRMGNLEIGDGIQPVTLLWKPSSGGTLYVRSLRVRHQALFLVGSATNSYANHVGNGTSDTLPHLTGGIVVEEGATIRVQRYPGHATTAQVNLDGGSLMNDGMIDCRDTCSYSLVIGTGGGVPASSHAVSGAGVTRFGSLTVAAAETLVVLQDINLDPVQSATLNGYLSEPAGKEVIGAVQTARTVTAGLTETFGGIGCWIRADSAPGATTVLRLTGPAAERHSGASVSIARMYDIRPARDTHLNATLGFGYGLQDLRGQQAAVLQLWRSEDGLLWQQVDCTVDTAARVCTAEGLESLSRWTAADTANSLGEGGRPFVVNAGWNIISVPLEVGLAPRAGLYPGAVSRGYRYTDRYVAADSLAAGPGYWLKFPARDTVMIGGSERLADTLALSAGWNLIGALSRPVPAWSCRTIPADLMVSRFFGYTMNYQVVDTLVPGRGYWLRASAPGSLILNAGGSRSAARLVKPDLSNLSLFSVIDGRGKRMILMSPADDDTAGLLSMPPMPPAGAPDARFGPGRKCGDEREYPLLVSGAEPPLRFVWEIAPGDAERYRFGCGAEKMRELSGTGECQVGHEGKPLLITGKRMKAGGAFSVGECAPDPGNPATELRITMPARGDLLVEVYDILGRKVKELHRGEAAAGVTVCRWEGDTEGGKTTSSGIYLICVRHGETSVVRKVVMLR